MARIKINEMYYGSTQVRPNPEQLNLDFDNANTEYRTTQLDSWAWALAVYWWTGTTSGDWICWAACSYATSIGVGGSTPKSPTSWPSGQTTWWCLAVYAAWAGSTIYTTDVSVTAWSHTLTYKYYSKRPSTSYTAKASSNRCWVIINWVGTYDTVTFNTYNSWQTRTVSFTMPSAWTVTISLGYIAQNQWSNYCPRVFFDDVSIT